ncbi:hypothetical protein [Serratia rubidaea]|uniref:hypothetical protein n=1 Tax=Serratia rubidaea TaxID=61652 RepID=UPI0007748C26|nr:hypothetical protein [Serratia rubidaea]
MAKLTESRQWEDGVYQIKRGDKVTGGRDGVANIQPQQLANRTAYLKNELETISTMAMADMGVYDSKEVAQDAINTGSELRKYFPVREEGNYWARRYENVEGIATPTEETLSNGAYIDAQLLRNIIQAINILPSNGIFPGISENPLEIGSEKNEVAFGINARGQLMAQAGFADLLGVKNTTTATGKRIPLCY